MPRQNASSFCGRVPRRVFLADTGLGFTGLALSVLLSEEAAIRNASAETQQTRQPHFQPKAKSVIWIFLCGGVSHLESFDVKPELNIHAGKSIDETPFKSVLDPEKVAKNLVGVNPAHGNRKLIMPLQTGYKAYGQSGIVVGDWFKHIGECVDDLAIVRSLWTLHNDHGTQLTWHTGRHPREGAHPTVGSWISYGLGSMNRDLPDYVVLGTPTGDCCGGEWTHGAAYLGAEFAGVRFATEGTEPIPYIKPDKRVAPREQAAKFELLKRLHRGSLVEYPNDPLIRARIQSYELAAGMQTAAPETLALEQETAETERLYGLDQEATRDFGRRCLVARRLVERGVRFVQIFHGGGGGGEWDAHSEIKNNHTKLSEQVDKPIAALLMDLKRRGLLDETIVVWGTEFGRSPGAEGTGRDHHPNGFSCFLAGGGIKKGVVHGATDELGFHATEHPHFVTDIHATVLHQMGLDPRKLEMPGRKRIDMDRGKPIMEIIA